jgi:hypothetical protein
MCCLSANPTTISFVPLPNGNVTNLGQIVVSSVNGLTYLIDLNGRGAALYDPRRPVYSITLPDGLTAYIVIPAAWPIPDPDDFPGPLFSTSSEMEKRLWVFRNQDLLIWDVDYTVSFVGDEQRLYFVPSLSSDIITIHIHHHAAIPYELYPHESD